VRRLGVWCETTVSLTVSCSNESLVRQWPASEDVKAEADEAMALEAVIR
jgi:hypothetical protein